MTRGKLIVIEGIECAGKDTQVSNLAKALEERGRDVMVVREPGGTAIGESLRAILKDPRHQGVIAPLTSLFLVNAARLQLMREQIRPALDQGRIVLSNRSYLSSLAYQGYAEGLSLKLIRQICTAALDDLLPDRIFLLDITIEEMLRRMKNRPGAAADRYDSLDASFHQKVRDGYIQEAILDPHLIKIIDGQQLEEKVTADLIERIQPLLDQGDKA